jgi:hypothetical protein
MRPLIRIDRTELHDWGLADVSRAAWGGACACGLALMPCLAAGAYRGSAAPVTARAAPAVAAERAAVGRRFLIRFCSVAMLILLTGVAA